MRMTKTRMTMTRMPRTRMSMTRMPIRRLTMLRMPMTRVTMTRIAMTRMMKRVVSLCSSPGCEGECFRSAKDETEVEGIGMCRVAGGFS